MVKVSTRSLVSLAGRLAAEQDTPDDASLLALFRTKKDQAAFGELVRRHGPLVLGVCRRMLGHAHDADDAFQATFLALARGARSIRKPNALAAWLYGVAVRVCRRAIRKRGQRPRPPLRLTAGDDPFADLAWKELRGLLDDELARLPETFRAPLVLCYFEGLTCDEASARLGWSRRTLLRHLDKGRQRLRARLERRGLGALVAGIAALSPGGLIARVPDELLTATLRTGVGGPVPVAVRALAAQIAPFQTQGAGAVFAMAVLGTALCLAAGPAITPPGTPSKSQAQPVREVAPTTAVDGDGRPLPAGAVFRLGSRKFRTEGRDSFLLPAPDGKHVLVQPHPSLSAYPAHGLMLLNADTGLRVRTFEESHRVAKPGSTGPLRPAAFSPDGSRLYALGWHKAEEEAGQSFYVWAGFDNPCRRVVLVWDVATGQKVAEWDLPPGKFRGMSSLLAVFASPDGKRLFVSGATHMRTEFPDGGRISGVQGLHVLDAGTGQALDSWEGAGHPVALSADGKEVVTFVDTGGVCARDVRTGKVIRPYPIEGHVVSVAVSPDGATVAAAAVVKGSGKPAWSIKQWETATGREKARLTADPTSAASWAGRLVFSGDAKTLYFGTGAGRVLRWNAGDGKELPGWGAHRGRADMHLLPGAKELITVGAFDGSVRRWDAVTGKQVSPADAYVGDLAIDRSRDGRLVVVGDTTGRTDVWDAKTGKVIRSLRLPPDDRRGLLFGPDGRHLIDATDDGKLTVRSATTGAVVRQVAAERQKADESGDWDTLQLSPDGKRLLAAKWGFGTRLLAWPEGKVVWQRPETHVAAFGPDGTILAGQWHGDLQFLDPESGEPRGKLPAGNITAMAVSPDGRRLVTTHLPDQRRLVPNRPEGAWRVRDAATGEVLKEVSAFRYPWSVAFSPSGWLLAVAGDNGVRVYETASWAEVARLDGHEGTVRSVFFGPDDATLISGSAEDGTALVWDLRPPAGNEPDPAKLWADLCGTGPTATGAVWEFARHPEVAVKLFRGQWPVPNKLDPGRVRTLIGDLDSPRFAVREAAAAELKKLGRRAEDELRTASAASKPAEMKQRAEQILDQLKPAPVAELPVEDARELRAVWALEQVGTAGARELLSDWATAKVGNRLCDESAAALKRLASKSE